MNYENQTNLIDRMKNYGKLIQETIDIIPTLPSIKDGELYSTSRPGDLTISAPYNIVEYRKFRRALGKEWKREYSHFNEGLGSVWANFTHVKTGVKLDLELTFPKEKIEGAICHLVKVGEVTKPVYEVVCND